ncbi:hypothetical protein ACFQY4_34065 [Catellatospora bangladeshensis]|uniref:DUF2178 domain-containing protein n=1 Tax=Catellatospora bangladeshensis TaxID=310355 RepID=A0A8J3JP64_9ACTN|nr:hypothetical protein [Catellatospora bangladeshensis]GIF82308.1 hypothetical protein Cba03nite_36570 [Catellatospora bangladeshensis]
MAFEEKRTWIMVLVTVAAYGTYVAVVLGRAGDTPLPDTPYAAPLLWSIGAAIAATIVLTIAASIAAPQDAGRGADERDQAIHRSSELTGQSFVVIGCLAAMLMALAEVAHFWIANVIYLAFVLSSLLTSTAKIISYRRGFQPW